MMTPSALESAVPADTATSTASAAASASASEGLESASDAVVYGIVEGLSQQRYVPGQRLVEVDLAEQYGVSRASVREALQRLAAQGLIEIVRNKGAVIRSLSWRETLDVLDVAERITGLLARSAARAVAQGASGAVLEDAMVQLTALQPALDGQGPPVSAGLQADGFAAARRGFYRALLDVSASKELRRLLPSIHIPIVYAQHRPASLQQVRMRDYQRISEAVLQGNEAAADEAGMQHVRNVREAIMSATLQGAVQATVPAMKPALR